MRSTADDEIVVVLSHFLTWIPSALTYPPMPEKRHANTTHTTTHTPNTAPNITSMEVSRSDSVGET